MGEIKSLTYEIHIGGKKLGAELLPYIDQIDYEENAGKPDTLSIAISDPDFVFINNDLLIKDQEVVFIAGWLGEVSKVKFTGYISVVDVDFPDTGTPTLIVHCMDESHILNRKKRKRTWGKVKASDVAKKIAAEYGLVAVIDATPTVEDTISQSGQTDAELLTDLAERQFDPWLFYVENGKLYFKRRRILDEEQATLAYREAPFSLQSFSPRIDKETKKEEVTHANVNHRTKKVDKGKANNDTPRDVQGQPIDTAAKKGGTSVDSMAWGNTGLQQRRIKI